MARKTAQEEAPDRPALKRGRHRSTSTEDSPQAATEKEEGFLFDAYWDDAFSAYFDPTLRTCCQIRY